MRTRWLITALLLLLLVLVPAAALAEVHVMVVTDLHYLSPSLYAGSELFLQAIARGDGKMTHRSDVLLAALLTEARRLRPDALVIAGDLTFNGEAVSHRELAEALRPLAEEGIPVWVIPGNHDINNPSARRFLPYSYEAAENVSPEVFGAVWADFMRPTGVEGTFSYAVRVTDRVWLALLDVSRYRDVQAAGGLYTRAHHDWLTGLLREAKEENAAVVAVAHQSVLLHSPLSPESFSMQGRETLAEDLRRGGVSLCLTGHVHIQHRRREAGLTDVATGALSVSPHRYGWVTVGEDGQAVYEMRSLPAESLPEGFAVQSALFFAQTTVSKLMDSLGSLGLSREEMGHMLTLAARFNSLYFGGTLDVANPLWKTHPGWELWQRFGDRAGFGAYMNMTFQWEETCRKTE